MKFEFPGNRTILRCSACGSECKKHTTGWWYLFEWVAWIGLCYTAFEPVLNLPGLWSWVLTFAICIPFQMATRRLYHAYWAWRHPTRCDGAGHLKPHGVTR